MLLTLPLNSSLLQVAVVRDDSQLSALAERWDALAGDVPFSQLCLGEHLVAPLPRRAKELFVITILDEQGDVVGIAPWFLATSPHEGRVVRFLGSGEICSDYLTVLAEPDAAEAVIDGLAEWLAGDAAELWNLLDLSGVEEADPLVLQLGHRLAELGHVVDRQTELNCWRTELPGDWDQLLARLSKAQRAKIRALLRRNVDTGRTIVHQVQTEEDLERGFAVLVELHQKRRQSLSEAGCFASRQFTDFHRDISRQLLADGQLRLIWTELEGRAATAEYSVVGGDTVFYYLGGFEPELAEEGPGWLSLAVSLKRAVEQGYRAYDFLRGDESYKASWNATARPLVRVRIVGNHATARMRFAAWQACREIKLWARQLWSRSNKG